MSTAKAKLPQRAKPAKKPSKPAKTRSLSQAEKDAYAGARDRARVPGGYTCEHCFKFIAEGKEHAHHIVYGRLHGTRKGHTTKEELAIVGGDFSTCKCHIKIHKLGIKDASAFRLEQR